MAWYSSWTRAQRLVITVPAGTVAPLPYFPVVLTAASLPTELTNNTYGRSDGGDLAFAADLGVGNSVSSIGAQLPCEVVSAAFGGSPSAEIHVQVPSVAATGTLTYIWVLYGNSGQTAQPAAGSTYGSQKVWNENGTQNYQGVWHWQGTGTPTTWTDSTSLAHTGTNHSATAGTGSFGGCMNLSGSSQYADVGASNIYSFTTQCTLNHWFKSSTSQVQNLCGWSTTGDHTTIAIGNTSVNYYLYGYPRDSGNSGILMSTATTYCDGAWHHAALVINGTSGILYVDGVSVATTSSVSTTYTFLFEGNITAQIGANQTSSFWKGSIDETRISAAARSASWIAAEFSNQSAPGTFILPPGGQGPLPTLTFMPWIFNSEDC